MACLHCSGCREETPSVASAADVYRAMAPLASKASKAGREHFWAVPVDVRMRMVGKPLLISMGSLTACIVHPREAFRALVKRGAYAVIFCHNHPSGDSSPSNEDDALTRRLVACGDLLGIRVLDHVVIGRADWHSYAENGGLR